MTKWEYKTVKKFQQDYDLDTLGRLGWELVSHSIVNRAGTWDSGTISHYYLFKRKIP